MKILCIDTSSKLCSVAILEDTQIINKIELDNGLTHSETLIPAINEIFNMSNLDLHDINLLVCDIGPGSFTGIRIGIATVKAFSDSFNIPTIGISSLEALAYNIKNGGLIVSMLDCKNNNCYYAIYELNDNIYTCIQSPDTASIDNVLDLLKYKYSSNSISFVGDACILHKTQILNTLSGLDITISSDLQNNINIYNLGLAGLEHYKKSDFHSENILPLYLKKPQAQRQLEERNFESTLMTLSDLKNIELSDFDDFWNISNLTDELNSNNSKFIVAKYDNNIIGFAGIKIILDNAELMNIAVHKDFRRQGVAKLLLSNLINMCVENNIKSINLEVNEINFPAINLYKNFDFKIVGKRPKYYDNKYDAILMDLVINP